MAEEHDFAIIGAGPAGSTAAAKLDSLGADYAILDRAEFPREKPCAGVLSPKIKNMVEIPDEIIERKLTGYRIFGPSGRIVESEFPEYGAIVRREVFDNYMVERIKNWPVKNHVTGIVDEGDLYRITGREGEVKARYVIGADGCSSVCRRIHGARISKVAIAAQYEFALDRETVDERVGDWFEVYYFTEHGYGWLSPTLDGMKIGIGILADRKPDIWSMLETLLDSPVVAGKCLGGELVKKEAHSIPMSGPVENLAIGKTLLTGDAGGFVYPGTGEGIYYAMKSGEVAADVVHRHLASGGNFDLSGEYEKALAGAGLLALRDVDFIEKNLASSEKAEQYVKKLGYLAKRGR